MNVHRAQEIIATNEKINVELNGTPVWIDSVDSTMELARVHAEQNPADARTVAVQELKEVH
ncbi:H-type small acid-soluble spore protein [Paenibacillus sedimenti]|uniref:H-type small acid-soluble spore protein n=1 Tax=Paenibacillus sedimenti TaxID=2770274 RepID=A0A926KLT5_9BACL|nr:H-type small acid-soluble spore protein [Paenibacillus sedimenti]MBD0379657.1 H-type small acid-soluble spore protein [Paenibacillus sedimenti]